MCVCVCVCVGGEEVIPRGEARNKERVRIEVRVEGEDKV